MDEEISEVVNNFFERGQRLWFLGVLVWILDRFGYAFIVVVRILKLLEIKEVAVKTK